MCPRVMLKYVPTNQQPSKISGINARPKTNMEGTHHSKEKPCTRKHEMKTNELVLTWFRICVVLKELQSGC